MAQTTTSAEQGGAVASIDSSGRAVASGAAALLEAATVAAYSADSLPTSHDRRKETAAMAKQEHGMPDHNESGRRASEEPLAPVAAATDLATADMPKVATEVATPGEHLCPHGYRLRHGVSSDKLAHLPLPPRRPTFELDMHMCSPFTESRVYAAIKAGSCMLLREGLAAAATATTGAVLEVMPPGGGISMAVQLPLDLEFGCSYMHVVADSAESMSGELRFVPMVHELALAGVDPQLADNNGRTALDIAAAKNLRSIAEALLQVGATISQATRSRLRMDMATTPTAAAAQVLLQAKLAEHSPSLGQAVCAGDCGLVLDQLARWHRIADVRHGKERLLDLSLRLAEKAAEAEAADAEARAGVAQVLRRHARPADFVHAVLAGNTGKMQALTLAASPAECAAMLALARWQPPRRPSAAEAASEAQRQLRQQHGHQRTLREAAVRLGHDVTVLAALDRCLAAAAEKATAAAAAGLGGMRFGEPEARRTGELTLGASVAYRITADGRKQSLPVQSSTCTII